MSAMSRLGKQLEEAIATLAKVGAPFALIGGLALASHKVIRATQDIDLLTDAVKSEDIHRALLELGYQCLHRSSDAGNYVRGDERIDFIYAHRPASLRLLRDAITLKTTFGELRVVSTEGLIGLKLQGFVNDPRRTQDMEDIRALIAANRNALRTDERVFSALQSRDAARGNSQMSSPFDSDPLFVAEGGIAERPVSKRDPYEVLDDLMTVVEALCPTWPHREPFPSSARFLL